jgi:hypothetical protein
MFPKYKKWVDITKGIKVMYKDEQIGLTHDLEFVKSICSNMSKCEQSCNNKFIFCPNTPYDYCLNYHKHIFTIYLTIMVKYQLMERIGEKHYIRDEDIRTIYKELVKRTVFGRKIINSNLFLQFKDSPDWPDYEYNKNYNPNSRTNTKNTGNKKAVKNN